MTPLAAFFFLSLLFATEACYPKRYASQSSCSRGSHEALPVVVINRRHVPREERALAEYNAAHLAASSYMMEEIRGTKAAFQSTDTEDPTLVHDLQWWDSLDSFLAHVDPNNPKMQEALNNWIPKYNHTIPFKGHVFGGWTEKVKEITVEVGGADFMLVPRSVGFIKQTGDGLAGPPVIVYNHRRVLPGRMGALLKAQQAYADYMYDNVAGVLALTAGVDTEDPLLLHDFQVFSNFQIFRDHADISNPVVKKLLFDWINFDNYDAKTPFNGEVWVAKEHLEQARQMTQEIGGAQFTFYPIEEIQGSVDLNNWE